ncbi:SMP-30/gluconolactonase/LRE family protein [Vineibacter terrae]|uniref:SMP-30/gluconolactonase/LRE family protein n=1 Tax=Vineibacter terrae TaxID=2586908 RepID=A0A5C8PDY5_9HYPH|nr:SMP-30/gluconolactonase/LRE family protein [Vineibacter terrae]TXL71356.1 SMP-30/gluconolactonase/LRE family protein [Vineibacter terrae]
MTVIREITSGLRFPEGPIWMPDGSVILVEIERGTLTRVRPDGRQEIVARTGGGPNGAAIGPDGKCYVCNNGGFKWHEEGGLLRPVLQADDYGGGRIERVDLQTGAVETLYTGVGDIKLRGPNDIVFDRHGGFWFTDLGKVRQRDQDRGGVFYAKADGSLLKEVIHPMIHPNGIGLSPEGDRLYVVESPTGRLWAFEITGPGEIKRQPWPSPNGGKLIAGLPGYQLFDSLAVEASGNVCVATLFKGCISVISPDGDLVEQVSMPDLYTTNICFGGPDMGTAFITLSNSGRLVAVDWKRPGLALAH